MSADGFTIDNPYHWPIKIPLATTTDAGLMSPADKAKLDAISPGGGDCLYDFCANGNDTINGLSMHPIVTFTPAAVAFGDVQQIQIEYLVQTNNGGVQAQLVSAIFSSVGGVISFVQQSEVYNQGNATAIVSQASTDGSSITISVQGSDEEPLRVRVRVQGNVWEAA